MRAFGLIFSVILLLMAGLAGSANGDPTVHFAATFKPEHLGSRTAIQFGFTVTDGDSVPPPLIDVQVSVPANLGVVTSGLGLAGCKVQTLEADGPSGCPPNSVMGYGFGLVEVPFGPEILRENTRIAIFAAPIKGRQLNMLFYVLGESPVATSLVLPTEILPALSPFGGILDTKLPLVPTLPEAPDAAVVELTSTLGPAGITYFEYKRGERIPYRPRGIVLPKSCPLGGFRFAANFEFQNLTRASSSVTIPCPHLRTGLRNRRVGAGHHLRRSGRLLALSRKTKGAE